MELEANVLRDSSMNFSASSLAGLRAQINRCAVFRTTRAFAQRGDDYSLVEDPTYLSLV